MNVSHFDYRDSLRLSIFVIITQMKYLKIIPVILLLSWLQPLNARNIEWVSLGYYDFTQGYKTLYRLNLEVPRGVHDIYDIKKGQQIMRFKLTWLPPKTSQKNVKNHFVELLESQFESVEDLKFNQTTLNRLYDKLPEALRHDEWIFEYSPDAGTKLYIADKKIHSMIGSEVNNALHHSWLLSSPVVTSKLMNRLLKAQK